MENLENKNPTAYTGDEIIERKEFSLDSHLKPKILCIYDVKKRSEDGFILYLKGEKGEKYSFEFESSKGGDGVRRQFMDDIGVWDIFDNIWDIDYEVLIGKKIEAFASRNGKQIVAVSPIFMPRTDRITKSLDNIFSDKIRDIEVQENETEVIDYKNSAGILLLLRKNIQNSVRHALELKRQYLQSTGDTEVPESYYNFLKKILMILNRTNMRLEDLYAGKKLRRNNARSYKKKSDSSEERRADDAFLEDLLDNSD